MDARLDENAFVLSVDDTRYEEFKRNLKDIGLNGDIRRIANSTTTPEYDIIACKAPWYVNSRFNAVGCCHYLALQEAKRLNLPYAIIYEDDAYPCDDAPEKFKDCLEEAERLGIDFGCLIFGRSGISCEIRGIKTESLSNRFMRVPCRLHGAHAYLVKNGYYDAALERFSWWGQTGNDVDHAACDFNLCYPPLKTIVTKDSLFFQKNGEQIKQPANYDIDRTGGEIISTYVPRGFRRNKWRKKREGTQGLPFDAVYVLTSKNTKIRMPDVHSQLKAIGFGCPEHIRYAPASRLLRSAVRSFPMSHYATRHDYSFDCTIGHYLIYQEALACDYDRILVVEDDVRFLNDIEALKLCLDELPNDADWAMLDWWPNSKSAAWTSGRFKQHMEAHAGQSWVPWARGFELHSTGAYIMSADGMAAAISIQDASVPGSESPAGNSQFLAADDIFSENYACRLHLSCYLANPILARQADNVSGRGGASSLYLSGQITHSGFDLKNYAWEKTSASDVSPLQQAETH